MVERSELENNIRNLIAYDILKIPLSSLSQKAGREQKKLAKKIAKLDFEEEPRISAELIVTDEYKKARSTRKAINKFKEDHPRVGEELEEYIQEEREYRKEVLKYRLEKGFKLGAEDYFRVMRNLGFKKIDAAAMVPHILEVVKKLGKASEYTEREILVK